MNAALILILALFTVIYPYQITPIGKWDMQLNCIQVYTQNEHAGYYMPIPGNIQTFAATESVWSDKLQEKVEGRHFICFITQEEECAIMYKDKEHNMANIKAYCQK